MPLYCRFYAEKFPELEETVMVNVREVADMGAYVSLLEYNNIEGMILMSELSRRRIRSVNKLVRVNRIDSVVVIRVDQNKGYIDLSKRRVTTKDLVACEERFAKGKAVNSILRHVADLLGYQTNAELEALYDKTAWYIDRKFNRKMACYDVFKKAIGDPSVLDECPIDAETKEKLLEDIKKRLTPQSVQIRGEVEVSCFGYEGIDAVKAALMEGLKCASETMPIKINLIAAPKFMVSVQTLEREEGLAAVNVALTVIQQSIEAAGGTYQCVAPARVVSDLEEREHRRRLELLELENQEQPADEQPDDEGLAAPAGLDEQADAVQPNLEEGADSDDENENENEKNEEKNS